MIRRELSRLIRAVAELIDEAAKTKRLRRKLMKSGKFDIDTYSADMVAPHPQDRAPTGATPSSPEKIDPASPEWFKRVGEEIAKGATIGGIPIEEVPMGPPADPGRIGPPEPPGS